MKRKFDVSKKQAASILGVSLMSLWRFQEQGLPYLRDAKTGKVFYCREDIEKLRKSRGSIPEIIL